MPSYVFDLECNGFKPTLIHCVGLKNVERGGVTTTTSYENMRKFFSREDVTLIAHNGIRFDVPVLEKILGIKVRAKLVDTLSLSWYLYPKRLFHGLEAWGEEFGVPKPAIADWDNLPIEEYLHRVEEDVKINAKLWEKIWKDLLKLYGDAEKAWRLIDYLTFKMDCAREQEASRWLLDVVKCTTTRDKLVALQEEKVKELAMVMPKVPVYGKTKKPAKLYKLNGELSEIGKKWFAALERNNLPADTEGVVEEVVGWKEPNPGSHTQIKDWLYGLGWEPETFEFKRNKETGDIRQIPQINLKHGAGVCPSIKRLFVKEPGLKVLEGLSILTHRIGVLNGFLANVDEDGYVQAKITGLTNTLRFKHGVVVNLPGIDKPYGADIRGCLVCPEGFELAGSDMKALEDRTKQHYMWPHDPDYVRDMLSDDFDPHIDIAVFAGLMSQEDGDAYKAADKEFEHTPVYKALKVVRAIGKKGNYTAVYGAGDAAIARAIQRPLNEGKRFKEAYWKRNWSVLAIAEEQVVKKALGGMWLFNPVSQLWYSLRYEKDRFSTLNQGTGVWCFDLYVRNVRAEGLKLCGQFHDEWIAAIKKGLRERLKALCQRAIDKTNEELKLNRELDFSVDFGLSYADIH